LLLTVLSCTLYGQNDIKSALEYWEEGNIKETEDCIARILKTVPENDTIALLKAKTFFVQGKYRKAAKLSGNRTLLSKSREAVNLTIEAFLHLHDYKNAVKVAEIYNPGRAGYLTDLKNKPFKVIASKTYLIPFAEDSSHTSEIIPLTTMYLNGVKKQVMFDTGADYLILGENIANELGLKYAHQGIGEHATTQTKLWFTVIDRLSFDSGPAFFNVPVTIMGDGPDLIIWGTNILEPFLSTIDYPNRQFILTPRNSKLLCKRHLSMLLNDNPSLFTCGVIIDNR